MRLRVPNANVPVVIEQVPLASVHEPIPVVPSLYATVPSGVPVPFAGATDAVSVTTSPTMDAAGLVESVVVVAVRRWLTKTIWPIEAADALIENVAPGTLVPVVYEPRAAIEVGKFEAVVDPSEV